MSNLLAEHLCNLTCEEKRCCQCQATLCNAVLCGTCRTLQPLAQLLGQDAFSCLGFIPSFDLDTNDLEARYISLLGQVHPDQSAWVDEIEKADQEKRSIKINQSYETLCDPLRRGGALLELYGFSFDLDKTACQPHILMAFLEMQEEIDGISSVAEAQKYVKKSQLEKEKHMQKLKDLFQSRKYAEAADQLVMLRYAEKNYQDSRHKCFHLMSEGENVTANS